MSNAIFIDRLKTKQRTVALLNLTFSAVADGRRDYLKFIDFETKHPCTNNLL